jgi:tetratricopeptide (TPR) repeat protein
MLRPLTTALLVASLVVSFGVAAPTARAAKGNARLEEMSLDRWAKLRETERYQLKIAEKYYTDKNWKVAAGEYEKYISLYEQSEAAPYSQLKWAICQVHLKKLNTAVKDGYQTVIDYWPDSPEAVAAAYLIGKTYKEMGDLPQAKNAYQNVLAKHADEVVAILARLDLADIARIEQDRDKRISVLKDLVYNAPRTGDATRQIVDASATLASLLFYDAAFLDAKNALATSYKEPQLVGRVAEYLGEPLANLYSKAETKERALKMADSAINYYREQQPKSPADDAERSRDKQMVYYMASTHAAVGRPEESIKLYEQLLKTYKNDDDVLDHYAGWMKTHNRRDEARVVYGRMKDQIVGQAKIAASYREENKFLQAATIYEDLVSRDASNAGKWQWQLAEAYRDGGKYKEAIAVFQQCDNYPTCLMHMGYCYRALKQYREAIGMFSQVVGGYESSAPQALLQIAYTQEQAGQSEAAITTLQQVCKRYPRSGDAATAHQHLNNKYKITFTLGGAKDE